MGIFAASLTIQIVSNSQRKMDRMSAYPHYATTPHPPSLPLHAKRRPLGCRNCAGTSDSSARSYRLRCFHQRHRKKPYWIRCCNGPAPIPSISRPYPPSGRPFPTPPRGATGSVVSGRRWNRRDGLRAERRASRPGDDSGFRRRHCVFYLPLQPSLLPIRSRKLSRAAIPRRRKNCRKRRVTNARRTPGSCSSALRSCTFRTPEQPSSPARPSRSVRRACS
mmetsp:Transcript_21258/g.45427  ORF Transcript_21258/g.45427 Transcript_21258/m.45427 type:complete len:221 (-) Transcript_21258:149-811(-)